MGMALKLLWNGSEKAIKLLCNCSEVALKWLWNGSEIALKLLWNFAQVALKLLLSCTEVALKLLWSCSEVALKWLWKTKKKDRRIGVSEATETPRDRVPQSDSRQQHDNFHRINSNQNYNRNHFLAGSSLLGSGPAFRNSVTRGFDSGALSHPPNPALIQLVKEPC